ncbi:MAG: rhodanese-like domain-containing protein [Thermoleophilaceae bacterium]|nr:rhodanese-like domain-containing protein [Thermoleophilaceae bacterium]
MDTVTQTDIAQAHFANRLAVETDVADVAATLTTHEDDFVLLDVRSRTSYDAGHLPGAVRLHHSEITKESVASLPEGLVIAYCWGPACNGACKAALRLAELGRPVKEMLGGFDHWVRDGHPVETSS